MVSSFSVQTRQAVRSAEVGLPAPSLAMLVQARAARNRPSGERDRLLEAIIWEYRRGPREVWAAVLLDVVTPAILVQLSRYRTDPPSVDVEDIRQQFVVELLAAATTMPMPPNVAFVERRLILRAGQGVRRWLRSERRRLARSESLEALREAEEGWK